MQLEAGQEMRHALGRVFVATVVLEALGALLLFVLWRELVPDPWSRAGWAVFHAVSAFCNAGFALFADHASLTAFAASPPTLAVIAALVVLGGLGFAVIWQGAPRALRRKAAGERATGRHVSWVLATTVALLAAGAIGFWWAERRGVLASLGPQAAWLNAAFHSASLRTAGFATLDLAPLGLSGAALSIVLMLIGGSPASTAGGMKTTTAAVALLGALRLARFAQPLVRRALELAATYLGAWLAFVLLLALAQGALDRRIAFEAASALGTVGLSMGVTGELTGPGKLVVCLAMFAGRVGPFALVATLLPPRAREQDEPRGERILLG
jgi:Trk-type K+ transport system membrane component